MANTAQSINAGLRAQSSFYFMIVQDTGVGS